MVIDDLLATAVKNGSQMTLGHGHAHGIGKSLTQRTRGGFHAGGMAVLRMPGRLAAPLAEIFYFFEAELITRQVKQTVQKHGCMASRQHKAVTINPLRIFWIMLQHPGPKDIGGCGQSHGRAGVA